MPRADGRWNGQITSRPLPDAREELNELAPGHRRALARIWFAQAATEARVATSFAIVHRSLAMLGADEGLTRIAQRAVDDEHRHAALCHELAQRYADRPLPATPSLSHLHPTHPTARSQRERAALYIVGQCALNETFACAYLHLAREGCTSPLVQAALKELLMDEIDHSRVGWAFLQTMDRDLHERVDDWVTPLTICNVREWISVSEGMSAGLEKHGIPRSDALRDALGHAVQSILIPGFAGVGLNVQPLENWVKLGMDTLDDSHFMTR